MVSDVNLHPYNKEGAEPGGPRTCRPWDVQVGWTQPAPNPRSVVFLAFVIGLGFAWTENIQYGAMVYEQVSAMRAVQNETNVTNITINVDSISVNMFQDGSGNGTAEFLVSAAPPGAKLSESPEAGDDVSAFKIGETVTGVVGKGSRHLLASESEQGAAWEAEMLAQLGLEHVGHEDGELGRPINITVNMTRSKTVPAMSEEERQSAALAVCAVRGVLPMHAVWAAISSMRFVRSEWMGSGADPIDCIKFSWLYHGVFDFVLIASPAFVEVGYPPALIALIVSFSTLSIVIGSWIHLARGTSQLEGELEDAGHPPNELSHMALCDGARKDGCCCLYPCILMCCVGDRARARSQADDAAEAGAGNEAAPLAPPEKQYGATE